MESNPGSSLSHRKTLSGVLCLAMAPFTTSPLVIGTPSSGLRYRFNHHP
jgi:hypothetical protein